MKRSQVARLIHIHEKIKSGSFYTAKQLANDWEGVSDRTIRRDIDYLRDMMNAPIEYSHQHKGYYYTEKGFDIPAFTMTEGDIFSLAVGEVVLENYRGSSFYNRLSKIFDRIRLTLPEETSLKSIDIRTVIGTTQIPQVMIEPDSFNIMAKAVSERCRVSFLYRVPSYTDYVDISCDPFRIIAHKGNWYMLGREYPSNKIKIWAISRMKEINEKNESFELPADFDIETYIDNELGIFVSDKKEKVSILFSREVAGIIKERTWHKTQELDELEDGSVRLSFITNQLDETLFWAFTWGSNAVIEAPMALVKYAKNVIEDMLEGYQKGEKNGKY